jgi:hypothetical protein
MIRSGIRISKFYINNKLTLIRQLKVHMFIYGLRALISNTLSFPQHSSVLSGAVNSAWQYLYRKRVKL